MTRDNYSTDNNLIFREQHHAVRPLDYCSNQPRMKAAGWTGDTLAFEYLDAGGLASADDGHMVRLEIRIRDKRHFTAIWTYRDHGKDTSDPFEYTRVK